MEKREGWWIAAAALAGAGVVAYAAFQGMIGLRIALPLAVGIPIFFAAPGLKLAARGALACGFALLFGVYALAGAAGFPGIEFAGPAMLFAAVALVAAFRMDGIRDDKLNRVFLCWVGVILGACLIGFFSGPSGSAGLMRRFLEGLGVSEQAMDGVLFALRKSIHVGCYWCSAWLAALAQRGDKRAVLLGGTWALSFAVYDEWNQASFPDRTGTPVDLVWDGVGILFGLLFAWLNLRKKD
jgi:hypothetical protein